MAKGKGMNTAIVVAIIGVIGTLLAALISSPWFGDLVKPSPVPTTEVPVTTGPTTEGATAVPTNTTLVFQEDFEDQTLNGISPTAGTWEIVKDKANYVYQVTANMPSQNVLAEAVFIPADFASGIIEFRLKFIQPGKVYLNFREQGGPGYYLLIDSAGQVALGYESPGANGWIEYAAINSQPFTIQTGTSYLIHIEARGEQMTISVDGNHVFSATDTRLIMGRLTFTATNGTVASFDDIKVWSFGP